MSRFCYVQKFNLLFKIYRCSTFDQFIKKAENFERKLTTSQEGGKHVLSTNVYQLRERLFDKLYSTFFGFLSQMFKSFSRAWQFVNLNQFVCTTSFVKPMPSARPMSTYLLSVSITSNVIEAPFFLNNSDPREFVDSFVVGLDEYKSSYEFLGRSK